MKCAKCGAELPAEAKFCMMCGEPAASSGDLGKLLWKDDCVDVVFAGVTPEKGSDLRYFVGFYVQNNTNRKIVPLLYSLIVNGRKIRSDAGMQVMDGMEIEPGAKKFCGSFIRQDELDVDIRALRSIRASVGYCLRSDEGYNYGADQYNFEEKVIHLPG